MGSSRIDSTQAAHYRVADVICCRGRAPSLVARQILSSLIAAAVRDRCQYITYSCEQSECTHGDTVEPDEVLTELASLLMTVVVDECSYTVIRGCVLSSVACSRRHDDLVVEFALTPVAIAAFHPGNPHSTNNIAEALFFISKYAPALLRLVRDKLDQGARRTYLGLTKLRLALGVDDDKYLNWNDFRRFVLDPAAAEVNEVTHFDITMAELRQSRKVIGVDLQFAPKSWLSHIHQRSFRGVTCDPLVGACGP